MDDPIIAARPQGSAGLIRFPSLDGRRSWIPALLAMLLIGGALAECVDVPAARYAASLPRGQVRVWDVITAFGTSGYMFASSAAIGAAALAWSRLAGDPARRALLDAVAARATYFFVCIALSGTAAQAIKHLVGRMRPRFLAADGAYDPLGPTLRRIAHLFRELHLKRHAAQSAEDHRCAMPIAQMDIADALGSSGAHVNRTIQESRVRGITTLGSSQTIIHDWTARAKVSEFDPPSPHREDGMRETGDGSKP